MAAVLHFRPALLCVCVSVSELALVCSAILSSMRTEHIEDTLIDREYQQKLTL